MEIAFPLQRQQVFFPCPPIDDDDITKGAHFLTHLIPRCANCFVNESHRWRKGWHDDVLGRDVSLCNPCGLKFLRNSFCSRCHKIYGARDLKNKEVWLTCVECKRGVHVECDKTPTTTHMVFFVCHLCMSKKLTERINAWNAWNVWNERNAWNQRNE